LLGEVRSFFCFLRIIAGLNTDPAEMKIKLPLFPYISWFAFRHAFCPTNKPTAVPPACDRRSKKYKSESKKW
jgi:hypothetical protein